jgi:hypothetical protein
VVLKVLRQDTSARVSTLMLTSFNGDGGGGKHLFICDESSKALTLRV